MSVVCIFFGGIKMQVVSLDAKTVLRFFQEFEGVGGVMVRPPGTPQ